MLPYVPLALLVLDAVYIGPSAVARQWGFGIALGLATLALALFATRRPWLTPVTTSGSLGLVFMVVFSQLAFTEARTGFAYGEGTLYFGLLGLGLTATVLVFTGYLLRPGLVDGDRACRFLFNAYTIPMVVLVLAAFPCFSLLTPLFLRRYSVAAGFLAFQLAAWLVILGLSGHVADDALAGPIGRRGLRRLDVRRPAVLALGATLVVGTLSEATRGLWALWAGTAVLLVLGALSSWKMLKHVLGTPDGSPRHFPDEGSRSATRRN